MDYLCCEHTLRLLSIHNTDNLIVIYSILKLKRGYLC